MPIILRCSNDLPRPEEYRTWFAVTATPTALDAGRKLPGLAERLERAFVAERDTWWRLGRGLAEEPTADIAHMPTAGSFGSDFGIMLAWSRIVKELADGGETTLVLCDDPWFFRHLAAFTGVDAGPQPPLFPETVRRALRGFLARLRAAVRAFWAALRLRPGRRLMAPGDTVILVYGHPASDADGNDAYFGDLMKRFPGLKRLLHTDCWARQAAGLSADGLTASLHAWGSPIFALSLAAARWKPGPEGLRGEFGWLVRRARALENGGGGPAMNRWQGHCLERWLDAAKPDRVLWPWENHGWERALCRAARKRRVPSIGYQHTVIGPHQFNYSTATNPDGLESIPDLVVADGPAYLEEMRAWGMPGERLVIGGAFRFPRFPDDLFDSEGPVFVPLSAVPEAAAAQVATAHTMAASGMRVLVKPHPMYPFAFNEEPNMEIIDTPLAEQTGLSAVLYTTGTSGLEARLMGIPAYRLMLDDRIAIDVLPSGVTAHAVTADTAADAVRAGEAPHDPVPWEAVLGDPDYRLWETLLFGDIDSARASPKEKKKTS